VGINIPPLKERIEDIPELVNHYIKVYNAQLNKQVVGADKQILQFLLEQEWKGNVRELENAIERAMILCDDSELTLKHFSHLFSNEKTSQNLSGGLKSSVRKFERESIFRAVEVAENDKSKAAEILGLSLSSLYRKMTELGIN